MNRPVNFSAGPSAIPVKVLESLAHNIVNYEGRGLSLVEMSHRGSDYREVHNKAISLLRELMGIPENYSVLLLGGGATLQFSMLPMNLLIKGSTANYVDSGAWAKKAIAEAQKVGPVRVVWDRTRSIHPTLPSPDEIHPDTDAAYLHITSNETIDGIQWETFPNTENVSLAADMSSDILSRPVDVSRFGIIYAGAQKNLGPAGVTVLIIRNDLLERSPDSLGSYLNYAVHAKNNSLYNTPPVFSIWAMSLVLEDIKGRGGVEGIAKENAAKAKELYKAIDESGGFYNNSVDVRVRSKMNIVWQLADHSLETRFMEKAESAGLIGLKGHRSVGGCRASLYNAVPLEGVKRLTSFMSDFIT